MGALPEQQRTAGDRRESAADYEARQQLLAASGGDPRRPIVSQGFASRGVAGPSGNVEASHAPEARMQQRMHKKNIQNLKNMQNRLEK